MLLICVKREAEYFCNRGWTAKITLIPFNNLAFCEGAFRAAHAPGRYQLDTDGPHFVNPGLAGQTANSRPIYRLCLLTKIPDA